MTARAEPVIWPVRNILKVCSFKIIPGTLKPYSRSNVVPMISFLHFDRDISQRETRLMHARNVPRPHRGWSTSGREVAPKVHHGKHGLDGGVDEMPRKYKAGNVHAYAAFSIVSLTDPILLKLLFARRIPPSGFQKVIKERG